MVASRKGLYRGLILPCYLYLYVYVYWKRPPGSVLAQEGPAELEFPPRKFLLAISTATMVRMSTLVVLLRTSDRKLAFYAAIALKATELIIML